jgi:hypothetical protein
MRYMLAGLIIFTVYGGSNVYIARRMWQWVGLLFPNLNLKIYVGLYFILAVSLILGFMPLPPPVKSAFTYIGAYWMGIFMYLLIFTLLTDITVALGWAVRLISAPLSQNVLFFRGLTAFLLTFAVVGYGIFNANQIKTATYEVILQNAVLDGFVVVMISDLHLGGVNSEKNLHKTVDAINSLNPDIVCIVGDIFNDDFNLIKNPARAAELFRGINSTHGVFACLGNHDGGGQTLGQMIQFLADSNIKLLNDEYAVIDGRIALFGRLDSGPIGGFIGMERTDISELIRTVSNDYTVIVMEHNPWHITEYGDEVSLILSGHTHRGQVFPGSLITGPMYKIDYGHLTKNTDTHVIVTSGVHTWGPPLRVGTHNEVVKIIIR